MAATYSVGNTTVALSTTLNHAIGTLWNPSSTQRLLVKEVHIANTTAVVSSVALLRTSTIGTPATTLTPTIDSHNAHSVAPASVASSGQGAFSVQPTLVAATLYLRRWHLPAAVGAGVMWVLPDPIEIKPGFGLAIVNSLAAANAATVWHFVWDEA